MPERISNGSLVKRLQREGGDLEAGVQFLLCFHFPKVLTLAKKGGCRESPLMLLKAGVWLTMPDDEPLARNGMRCPRPGCALVGGRISHLIGRMLNGNLRGRGLVPRTKHTTR